MSSINYDRLSIGQRAIRLGVGLVVRNHRLHKRRLRVRREVVGEDNYPHLNTRLHGQPTIWIPPDSPNPPTLEESGLDVLERHEAKPRSIFKDIGAIVYYLKAVPWQIAGFDVETYRDRLRRLHHEMQNTGGLQTHYHRRFVVARKSAV